MHGATIKIIFLLCLFIFFCMFWATVPIIRRNDCIYVTLSTCYSVWMTVWYTKKNCASGWLYLQQLYEIFPHNICNIIVSGLTLILLTWRIWWDPNNASKWQMGFNSAFKGLSLVMSQQRVCFCMLSLFIHSFLLACAECNDSLPFSGVSSIPLCYIPFPSTLFHQLVSHPPSLHLANCFFVCL